MRVELATIPSRADEFAAPDFDDDSGVGIRYADLLLKPVRATTEDGRRVRIKRRGLKLTLSVGDAKGTGLLRRLEHGPDKKGMFTEAMNEAAAQLGARFLEEDGMLLLELDELPGGRGG